MKTIDFKYPIFAQIEDGDTIVAFNACCDNPLKQMIGIKVKWYDRCTLISMQKDVDFEKYIVSDLMLKSSYVGVDGHGYATTADAACEAISDFLDKEISKLEYENEHLSTEMLKNDKLISRMKSAKLTLKL